MPERRRKRTNQDRGTDEVKQDRSLLLYVLLSFVTFSVYHFYFMDLWAKDVNILCEKDGKHTVGVEKMMLFSVLTFGVYKYVWLAEIVDRICDNAAEYDVEVRQDSETFFVWMILVPVLGYLVAMYRAIQDITGILISAVGEKKGLFPLWKKATQTAGKKVIKDILLEHSTPADKIL